MSPPGLQTKSSRGFELFLPWTFILQDSQCLPDQKCRPTVQRNNIETNGLLSLTKGQALSRTTEILSLSESVQQERSDYTTR